VINVTASKVRIHASAGGQANLNFTQTP